MPGLIVRACMFLGGLIKRIVLCCSFSLLIYVQQGGGRALCPLKPYSSTCACVFSRMKPSSLEQRTLNIYSLLHWPNQSLIPGAAALSEMLKKYSVAQANCVHLCLCVNMCNKIWRIWRNGFFSRCKGWNGPKGSWRRPQRRENDKGRK